MNELTLLYRGPLSSCNYACAYCPFAKRRESRKELEHDRACLERLCAWVEQRSDWRLRIFFTPWGEALVRRAYRNALERLGALEQVEKLVIQTNLSAPLEFAQRCSGKLAVWATFHPDWADLDKFLSQCRKLSRWNVAYSVGVVGFPRFRESISRLRAALPPSIYLWINAVKSQLAELTNEERAYFREVDPLYELNTQHYPSQGRACGGGSRVIAVDGQGDMRTCHFQPQVLGNLYAPDWSRALQPRLCNASSCHCHIGYVHLDYLELHKVFGSRMLERIPHPEALLHTVRA